MKRVQRFQVGPPDLYFELDWYHSQAVGSFEQMEAAFDFAHYLASGSKHDLSPHPLFDPAYYRMVNPDLERHQNLFQHYLESGQMEGRRPHALFDPNYYVDWHAQVCSDQQAAAAPFMHFLSCDRFTPPTRLWDPAEPAGNDAGGRDQFLEYLRANLSWDFDVHPLFDAHWFRQFSVNAADARVPLVDYASRIGSDRRHVRAHPLIDENWYLDLHSKGMSETQSVLQHCLEYPQNPSHPGMSQEAYVLATGERFQAVTAGALARGVLHAADSPVVSVLIINIDSYVTTVACVTALRGSDDLLPHEVIVLDNCSSDPLEAQRLAQVLPDVRIIATRTRYSFGESNNLLAEAARGDYLLFLNNDAIATHGAVQHLLATLLADTTVMAVGPQLVYPDGTVQEAGGQLALDGSPVQLFKGSATLPDRACSPRACDYVSAACILVRRSAFDSVAGFSLVFEPAYFEDTDLCRRLRSLGDVLVDSRVRVPHFEGWSTQQAGILANKQAVQGVMRRKWLTRFEDTDIVVTPRPGQSEDRVTTPHLDVREFPKQDRATLYSPFGLMIGGGERYFLSMAAALSSTHAVLLQYPHLQSRHRLTHVQDELGLRRVDFPLAGADDRVPSPADLFIAMGNSLRPPVEASGKLSLYHLQFPFPEPSDLYPDTARMLRGYNGVVVNSQFTAHHTRRRLQAIGVKLPVDVVPPPCGEAVMNLGMPERPIDIVSVGRFFPQGHSKQQETLIDAARRLRRSRPDLRVVLAGAVTADVQSMEYLVKLESLARASGIQVLVNPSRSQLSHLLSSSKLYWHATGLGVSQANAHRMEHFGIAIVEAIAAGCVPLAVDAGGPREILSQTPQLLVQSVRDFVERSGQLLEDERMRTEVCAELRSLPHRYDDESFERKLRAVITSFSCTSSQGDPDDRTGT